MNKFKTFYELLPQDLQDRYITFVALNIRHKIKNVSILKVLNLFIDKDTSRNDELFMQFDDKKIDMSFTEWGSKYSIKIESNLYRLSYNALIGELSELERIIYNV